MNNCSDVSILISSLQGTKSLLERLESQAVSSFISSAEKIEGSTLITALGEASLAVEGCAVLRLSSLLNRVNVLPIVSLLRDKTSAEIAEGLRWLLDSEVASTPTLQDCSHLEIILKHIRQRAQPDIAEDFLVIKNLATRPEGSNLRIPSLICKIIKCIFTSKKESDIAGDISALNTVSEFANYASAGDKLISFSTREWTKSTNTAVRRSLETFVLLLIEATPKLMAVVDALSPSMAATLYAPHPAKIYGYQQQFSGSNDINSDDWRSKSTCSSAQRQLFSYSSPVSKTPGYSDFSSLNVLSGDASSYLVSNEAACEVAVNECRNNNDVQLAASLLEALEAKLDSTTTIAQDGWATSRKSALKQVSDLLQISAQHDDIVSSDRAVKILQRYGEATPYCYELATGVCCRLGQLPQALHYVTLASGAKPCSGLTRVETAPPSEALGASVKRAVRMYLFALVEMRQLDDALDFLIDIIVEKKIEVKGCMQNEFQMDSTTISHVLTKILKNQPDRRIVNRILDIIIPSRCQVFEVSPKDFIEEGLFGALVDMCVKHKIDEALIELVERYRDDWSNLFIPDLQSCGILIKTLGACRRVEDCRWIFWQIQKSPNLEPTEVTYGCILDALVNNNKVDEAVELFQEMKQTGKVKPNTIMYSTIVKGYAQDKQLDKALAINDDMRRHNVPINTVTYNTLVDACARVGAMDKAAGLLEDMLSSGAEPDLITFSTIAKGYCVQGDVSRAMQLLTAMRERGIRPDGILYNSLLDGCVRALRPDLCEQLWQQMQSSGIPPSNFTLTILIKMFGRAGKLNRAFEAVRQLPKKYGFSINAHVYTCLMSACIANREFSKSLEVFHCMKKDDVMPDAKTYETVLYGLIRWENYPEAIRIIREAFQLDNISRNKQKNNRIVGLQMDSRSMRNLWIALKDSNQLELGQSTMNDMQKIYGSASFRYLNGIESLHNKFNKNDSSTAASSLEISSHRSSREKSDKWSNNNNNRVLW